MALISCSNCGKEVSDKAKICPNCGCQLIEEIIAEETPIICEDCGSEIPPDADACPKCGCPISKDNEKFEDGKIKKKAKKPILILSIIVLIVVLGVGSFFAINSFKMNTLEESIYDALVIAAQDDAKNPSAMKVLQIGTVEKDGNGKMTNCIVKIQSTTALGAVNTEEIVLSSTGYFMTTKELSSGWLSGLTSGVLDKYDIDDNNENVNVKKINAALKKHWKEIGIE